MEKAKAKEKKRSDRDDVLAELEAIRHQHDGLLRAEDTVEFARDDNTYLHKKFIWDDSEAGQRFRLIQARQLIRVHITIYPHEKQRVRAYVSMVDDRRKGGGYRSTDEVLKIEALREQLVYQAHREMKAFISRYEHLEELAGVIAAMEGSLVVEETSVEG